MDNVVLKNISMVRFRPKMDPTKALHTLGFPSGSSLTDISLDDIQRRFVIKMHEASSFQQGSGIKLTNNEDVQIKKRRHSVAVSSLSTENSKQLRVPDNLDSRILHEAFQCLIRKKRGHHIMSNLILSKTKEDNFLKNK